MTCLNTGSCGFVNIGLGRASSAKILGNLTLFSQVISEFNRNSIQTYVHVRNFSIPLETIEDVSQVCGVTFKINQVLSRREFKLGMT